MKKILLILTCLSAALGIGNCQEFVQNTIQTSELDSTASTFFEGKSWFQVDSVFLYGGGKILSLVTADDNKEETTSPTGSLGLNFNSARLSCNLFFSYNAKQEISLNSLSDFGNSLMNPDRSGQSFTFSVKARLKNKLGLSASFAATDQDWKLNDSEVIDASPLVTKLGFYVRPFDFNLSKSNTVDFTVDVHYANRVISGDFGNADRMIDNNLINRKGYNGYEVQANIRFNAVKLYVQFSGHNVKGLDIPGFSGNQVLFGIDVTGDLVKIK